MNGILDKSSWWTGFWNSNNDPSDGCWFVINKQGTVFGNYMGTTWNSGSPNGWEFHLRDYRHVTEKMVRKLNIPPDKWIDSLICHPGIKIIDKDGKEECPIVRKRKWEKGSYK